MGLVFRLEIQVGAAVLVKNSSSCVADDGVFGFVHSGEDVVQGLQLLGREARLGEKSPRNEKWRGVTHAWHWLLTIPALHPPHP